MTTRPAVAAHVDRLALWMQLGNVRCARGHHIARRSVPLPAAGLQCRHEERGHACPEWVYVVACPAAGAAYVVRATKPELDHIATAGLTPLEALDYLGVPFAP